MFPVFLVISVSFAGVSSVAGDFSVSGDFSVAGDLIVSSDVSVRGVPIWEFYVVPIPIIFSQNLPMPITNLILIIHISATILF